MFSKGHHPVIQKTSKTIFWSSILHEPIACFIPLLPFILLKDLHATTLQIVLLTMLSPISALFSIYWSSRISTLGEGLKKNFLGASILARAPLLLSLIFPNVWLIILSSACYNLFSRASIPSWMEMLKLNLPNKIREKFFSIGSAIGYGEGICLAILMGSLLDHSLWVWRPILALALIISLIGSLVQFYMPLREGKSICAKKEKYSILTPWKESFSLLKKRKDFLRFQWAFMAGGFGLMMFKPLLPQFFDQILMISYRDLMIAFSVCKGLGFILTSQKWSQMMQKTSLSLLTSFVLLGFALFSLFLLAAKIHLNYIFIAYVVYGIAQAGSHLIWHLSGPFFAGDRENSSSYSNVNIVLVGVRGLLGPLLGGILGTLLGIEILLTISIFLYFIGIASLNVSVPTTLKTPISQ